MPYYAFEQLCRPVCCTELWQGRLNASCVVANSVQRRRKKCTAPVVAQGCSMAGKSRPTQHVTELSFCVLNDIENVGASASTHPVKHVKLNITSLAQPSPLPQGQHEEFSVSLVSVHK